MTVAILVSGCGAGGGSSGAGKGETEAASGAIEVTASGRIGPLRIDRSNAKAVAAAMGTPELVGPGHVVSAYPHYVALGYACSGKFDRSRSAFSLGRPPEFCETAFFINQETKTLSGLATSSKAFELPSGIEVGMPASQAEKLVHQRALSGCRQGFHISVRGDDTSIWANVEGGREVLRQEREGSALVILGGHVSSISVDSSRHPVGLQFC